MVLGVNPIVCTNGLGTVSPSSQGTVGTPPDKPGAWIQAGASLPAGLSGTAASDLLLSLLHHVLGGGSGGGRVLGVGASVSLSLPRVLRVCPLPPCLSLSLHEGSEAAGRGLWPGLCVCVGTAVGPLDGAPPDSLSPVARSPPQLLLQSSSCAAQGTRRRKPILSMTLRQEASSHIRHVRCIAFCIVHLPFVGFSLKTY